MPQRISGSVHLQLDPDGTLYAWQPRERRYLALSLDDLALLQAFGPGHRVEEAVDGAGYNLDEAAHASVARLRERGYLEAASDGPPRGREVAARYFEDQADTWLEGAYRVDGRGALRLRTTLRALADELGAGALRVLDLGCGAGQAAIALARQGHTVVALDRSEAMLTRARQLLQEQPPAVQERVRLEQGDVLGADPRRFDLVLALGLHVYLPSLESLFARARAALVPGGTLAASFLSALPALTDPDLVDEEIGAQGGLDDPRRRERFVGAFQAAAGALGQRCEEPGMSEPPVEPPHEDAKTRRAMAELHAHAVLPSQLRALGGSQTLSLVRLAAIQGPAVRGLEAALGAELLAVAMAPFLEITSAPGALAWSEELVAILRRGAD